MNGSEMLLMVLVSASVVGLLLQCLFLLLERRRRNTFHEMLVVATVTKVAEEINTRESRWYITANWTDFEAKRQYTFRSPPLAFHPALHEGDTITVSFDPIHPTHYQMHL
ncbi:MAG TPA: hypothetical protein VIY29_16685 [Ktedonobacteraceae bacterium]